MVVCVQASNDPSDYFFKMKRSYDIEQADINNEMDICNQNPVPNVIMMKRSLIEAFKNDDKRDAISLPQWRLMQWALQLHDLERQLSFCNRRNNVSKIRLL